MLKITAKLEDTNTEALCYITKGDIVLFTVEPCWDSLYKKATLVFTSGASAYWFVLDSAIQELKSLVCGEKDEIVISYVDAETLKKPVSFDEMIGHLHNLGKLTPQTEEKPF
jgi:hypothetical protein